MNSISRLTLGVVAGSLLVACSKPVNFREADSVNSANGVASDPDSSGGSGSNKTVQESFGVSPTTSGGGAVDIVWLIDQSPSMANEIDNVEENIEKFTDYIRGRTDLNMAVVADATFLPSSGAVGFKRFLYPVGSWDALSALSLSFCQPSQLNPTEADKLPLPGGMSIESLNLSQICSVATAFGGRSPYAPVYEGMSGTSFYRANVPKVFVVVTDDNPEPSTISTTPEGILKWGMSSKSFVKHAKERLGTTDWKMFSFTITGDSVENANCYGDGQGVVYEELAKTSKAQAFDICKQDWSDHFSSLAAQIISVVKSRFQLKKASVQEVLEVRFDNRVLVPNKEYVLQGREIVLNESITKGLVGNHTLKVTYSYE